MDNLIPVTKQVITLGIENMISARDLWLWLGITTNFITFFDNIVNKLCLKESVDYRVVSRARRRCNDKHLVDYYITTNIAECIAILFNPQKGSDLKSYFNLILGQYNVEAQELQATKLLVNAAVVLEEIGNFDRMNIGIESINKIEGLNKIKKITGIDPTPAVTDGKTE
jgi:phage anti-repressor protein